ncbi:hypothetical protein Tco_1409220 [Tanacetum coccineum]
MATSPGGSPGDPRYIWGPSCLSGGRLIGIDIAIIIRKPSKTSKHGHEERKSTKEARKSSQKVKALSQLWSYTSSYSPHWSITSKNDTLAGVEAQRMMGFVLKALTMEAQMSQSRIATLAIRTMIKRARNTRDQSSTSQKVSLEERIYGFDIFGNDVQQMHHDTLAARLIQPGNVRNRSRFGINKWYQNFALRNFDLEDMELESTNSGPTAKLPILKLGEYEMWAIRIKQYFQIQDYAL